ncbi:MAG: hypothetical protein PHH59_10265 [Methylovulum sp.]|uniref:hypothetical protein n=1 Tax=Methylovulum sp. TaxID=1916980 RepID=UPI002623119E|nr:hypothetical protein [Methylovulum sp.]MDD2724390.1 hypothetical protein [Methylovulum sp.]MDD5124218.1 hypothetical protein [Methylovulum sp.]
MQNKYDFSLKEQSKLSVPVEDMQVAIYLNKDVLLYLAENCQVSQENLSVLVNYLLSTYIEMARRGDL